MRINVPDGVDPMAAVAKVGSPHLQSVLESVFQANFVCDSTVTRKEREAVRYYFAYRQDCNSCAGFRAARDIPGYTDEEITDEWYDQIPNYKTWPGYTERERLAIEFCTRFYDDHLDLERDDELWNRMYSRFTQVEIEDLVILSGFVAGANRIREVLLGPAGSACAIGSDTDVAGAPA